MYAGIVEGQFAPIFRMEVTIVLFTRLVMPAMEGVNAGVILLMVSQFQWTLPILEIGTKTLCNSRMTMKKAKISDGELMAEKLGMIVLCEHCGKRLCRSSVARIRTWRHAADDTYWCYGKEINDMESDDPRIQEGATARKGPLADQYEWEPK
jgi:hypothetical protein